MRFFPGRSIGEEIKQLISDQETICIFRVNGKLTVISVKTVDADSFHPSSQRMLARILLSACNLTKSQAAENFGQSQIQV
jgi:DNA-binding protein YbaB